MDTDTHFSSEKPNLYSRLVIFIASLALSPFFGSLLFLENLAAVGKQKRIVGFFLISLVWNILTFKVGWDFFLNRPIFYALANSLGGLLLALPLWNHYMGRKIVFEKRSIWSPLLVIVFIYALFTILILFLRK